MGEGPNYSTGPDCISSKGRVALCSHSAITVCHPDFSDRLLRIRVTHKRLHSTQTVPLFTNSPVYINTPPLFSMFTKAVPSFFFSSKMHRRQAGGGGGGGGGEGEAGGRGYMSLSALTQLLALYLRVRTDTKLCLMF